MITLPDALYHGLHLAFMAALKLTWALLLFGIAYSLYNLPAQGARQRFPHIQVLGGKGHAVEVAVGGRHDANLAASRRLVHAGQAFTPPSAASPSTP
jgi:hypothetical protein